MLQPHVIFFEDQCYSPMLKFIWDSPGKNTGVGCHFLLQCMKVKSENEVAQSCPTLCDPRGQPTRLPHPWDSPGKNTGVGCHFLLQCRKVKNESEVIQSCPTLSDPMDCSLPGSSIHGFSRHEYWSGVPLPSPWTHLESFKKH